MQFSVRLCFSFAVGRHFQEVYLIRGLLGFAGLFGRWIWDNVVHRLLLKFGCPNVELEPCVTS